MFTDLDVGDRWVLGQDHCNVWRTLNGNISALVMNDLDFSHMFAQEIQGCGGLDIREAEDLGPCMFTAGSHSLVNPCKRVGLR
jgi:hypothetical protein